jgi:Protein of unknown function DUF262
MVLLDGQQRLTTLHMLITGEIPAYNTPSEIENDPRDLYFNLETGDMQYYQPTKMKDDATWQRVIDCFNSAAVNLFQIVQAKGLDGQPPFALADRLNTNLTRLRAIRDADLPAQIVPAGASLTDAIDIFDRVNSQGTKLTDAELALTHVTAKWPQARRIMKKKLDNCSKRKFDFGLTFMTRALTTVVSRRALFETIHAANGPTLVFEHLGAAVTPYVHLRLEDVEGHQVCVVDVERFAEPVFTKDEKGREFHVRVGNTTRMLDAEETLRYIESRGSGG